MNNLLSCCELGDSRISASEKYLPVRARLKFWNRSVAKIGNSYWLFVQVNIFQKHLFLHQLTQYMTKDCSFNCKFSTLKLQAQNMLFKYINCSECQKKNKKQFLYTTCSELAIFMYWTLNSMNNLSSYCGLVDARISASDKNLPVVPILY